MARHQAGKMDTLLEKAIAEEMKEIVKRHPYGVEGAGNFIYDTTTRMKVYDRALKLQMIKLKADDPQWGAAFNGGDE